MTSHHWKQCTCFPSQDRRKRQTISAADACRSTLPAAESSLGKNEPPQKTNPTHTHVFTYLPLRDSLLLASAIISKAPKSAFYGDPCLSGQFRGALVISLQACAQRTAAETHSVFEWSGSRLGNQCGKPGATRPIWYLGGGFYGRDWHRANAMKWDVESRVREGRPITELQPEISARRCFHQSEPSWRVEEGR